MTKVIVSAAGHGGSYSGAVHSPLTEKNLTLQLDTAFADALQRKYAGFRHVRARTTDTTVPLAQRVALAKAEKADVFLEIHLNAGAGTGPETYVAKIPTIPDLNLAAAVHGGLYKYLAAAFKVPDRGVKKADFYVLRETSGIPSILVEVLFLDHPTDRAAIQSPGFFDAVGEALADGVAEFLQLPAKDDSDELARLRKEVADLRAQLTHCQNARAAMAGDLERAAKLSVELNLLLGKYK